jgi:macrolide-specific efflux system membrane fusion protein
LQAKQNIDNANLQVTQAQNEKTTVDNDSKSTDADKAEADQKVTVAQSSVDLAKVNSDNAYSNYLLQKKTAALRTVTAPIAGTITTLNVKNGDQLGSSSSGSSAGSSGSTSSSSASTSSSTPIVIADLGSMKGSISINEVDAAAVKTGQKVSMAFDAIDGLTLTGKVERVSTIGTETSGVVSYPVTIGFDSIDSKVKPQMSLTATITTDVKQDVLLVSSSAIKTSGETSYVMVMKNGSPQRVNVEIGSANDTDTEIKSGLNEGDEVVTQTISASAKATSTISTKSNGLNLQGLTNSGGGPSGGMPPGN